MTLWCVSYVSLLRIQEGISLEKVNQPIGTWVVYENPFLLGVRETPDDLCSDLTFNYHLQDLDHSKRETISPLYSFDPLFTSRPDIDRVSPM